MAEWHQIKFEFDKPLPTETLIKIEKDLSDLDCDFPVESLYASHFFDYRNPMLGNKVAAEILLSRGAEGRYWIVPGAESDNPNPEESDSCCTVFRPGVPWNSGKQKYEAQVREKTLKSGVARWIKIASELKIPATPIPWDALETLSIYVNKGDREIFRAEVEAASLQGKLSANRKAYIGAFTESALEALPGAVVHICNNPSGVTLKVAVSDGALGWHVGNGCWGMSDGTTGAVEGKSQAEILIREAPERKRLWELLQKEQNEDTRREISFLRVTLRSVE